MESLMKYNSGKKAEIDFVMTKKKWEKVAKKLWGLLDAIDTASDIFKPEKNNFYKYVMEKANKRFDLITSDGYTLFPVNQESTEEEKLITVEITKAIREDAEMFYGYQSNIAMAFVDEYRRRSKKYKNRQDIHKIANTAAKDFLNMWIKE